jgi:aminoglycoside phosphotransferase (APT) family kinase protein
VERELAVLPLLAPLLPVPIPTPVFAGSPTGEYPWPFFGAPFLPGRELADAEPDDEARVRLARPLAAFLRALHTTALDVHLPVDFNRRTDMAWRVPKTVERLEEVERLGLWRRPASVDALLAAARELPAAEPTAIVHGDLHFRHLLVDESGALTGVIDWGDLCRADPSIDLVLFWSLFPPEGRTAFLDTYGEPTDDQLLRARVLALFLCAALAAYGHHEGMTDVEREAVDGLRRAANGS